LITKGKAYVLDKMTWPEVKAALETVELALVPVGSTGGVPMSLRSSWAICWKETQGWASKSS
jgi:hypothetical protein